MKTKYILLLLLFIKASPSFAFRADTLKIFYAINKYDLSSTNKLKINTLVDSLKDADTIRVFGYADYLGNTKDNKLLSGNRAETIKNYMLTLNGKLQIFTDGRGEIEASTNKTADGEPMNRRVDIISIRKKEIARLPVEPPKIKPVEIKPIPAERKIKSFGIRPDSTRTRMPELTPIAEGLKDNRSFNDKVKDLENLEVGSSISLEELTFQPGRHFLNPEAVRYLNSLLKYLKKHDNIVFEIQGHICCDYQHFDGLDFDTGDQTLSNNRAKFIYDYFLKNGIPADRMRFKGLGSSKPKAYPERTERDRYLNRQVEIMIVAK